MKLKLRRIIIVITLLTIISLRVNGQSDNSSTKLSGLYLNGLNQNSTEAQVLSCLNNLAVLTAKSEIPLRDALRAHQALEIYFIENHRFDNIAYMLDLLGIFIAQNKKDSLAYNSKLIEARQKLAAEDKCNQRIRFNVELAHYLVTIGKKFDGIAALQLVEQIVSEKGFTNLNSQGKLFAIVNSNSFGLIYLNDAKYDSAAYFFDTGLSRALTIKSEVWQGIISGNLAIVLMKNGKHDDSKNLLIKDYQNSRMNGELGSAIKALIWLADIEIANKNYIHAKAYLDSAEVELLKVGKDNLEFKSDLITKMHFRLAKLAQIAGNDKEAFAHYEAFYNSVLAIQNKLHAKIEVKNADRYFIEDNAYKVIQLEEQRTRSLFLIGVFTLFIILILALLIVSKRYNEKLSIRNAEIEAQKFRLEELNQQKNKLFSIVAHDLRGPLGSLTSLLEMYQERDITNEELIIYSNKVSNSLAGLNGMLDNLLNWARAGMEKGISVKVSNVNICNLSKEVINQLMPQVTNKNLQVNFICEKEYCINTDEALLTVVIRNLLSNAIKFSADSGCINFIVKENSKNNLLEIEIADNGVGMTSEVLKSILNAGSGILSTPGTKGETGSGLGILLSREFTESLNGQLTATSEIGKGTTFTLSLPL